VTGDTLIVRVGTDQPALINLRKPLTPVVDATVGVPFEVAGTIADDALLFGVDLVLLVDGNGVASTRVTSGGNGVASGGGAPFSISWTPQASQVGKTVRVDLQATDSGGNVSRATFNAHVNADQPPSVSILSPLNQSSYPAGTLISLSAAVQDDSPGTPLVTWSVDGVVVGTSSTPPFILAFRIPASSAGRALMVEAQARDSIGNVGHAASTIFSIPDTTPPSAAVVTPRANVDLANSQDLLITVAGQDDVGVTRVEVLFDGLVVLTDDAPAANSGLQGSFITRAVVPAAQLKTAATHTISARASDAAGNVGIAPVVNIQTHDDKKPTLTFLAPAPGASVTSGTTLDVLVDAQDDVAVAKVDLFADGTNVGSRTIGPFRFSVPVTGNSRSLPLRAVVTDGSGQTAEASLSVQVTQDDQPPLVAFRAPNSGARVFAGRPLTIEVVASDNVSVASAELFVNDVSQGPKTGGTNLGLYQLFTWTLQIAASQAGTPITLRARATDGTGQTAERTIEVLPVVDQLPKVAIVAPPPSSPYKEGEDVRVAVTATDDDGVVKLEGTSGGKKFPGSVVQSGPNQSPPVDFSKEQLLFVRAPIVSKGEPATVGAVATDTSGQEGTAEVTLNVALDTERPTALLTSPVPPTTGTLVVKKGGALGARVEVSDDVRVVRVATLVDGAEWLDQAKDFLTVAEEHFETVQVPNPQGPGQVLVSRRYVGTYTGVVSFAGLAEGKHTLSTRAFDPAGNSTDTSSVDFEIQAAVDATPPTVNIRLVGAPDDRTVVADSTITIQFSAVDDGAIQSVSLKIDGKAVTIPSTVTLGGSGAGFSVNVTMPAFLPDGERPISFLATATDATGKVGTASLNPRLVEDQPPNVTLTDPPPGSSVTEETDQPLGATVQDDVGITAAYFLMSTSAVRSSTTGPFVFEAPASSGSGLSSATLTFTSQSTTVATASVQASPGRIQVSPLSSSGITGASVALAVNPGASGASTVFADVTYRYRSTFPTPAITAFERTLVNGTRTFALTAPGFGADLSYPNGIFVESIEVAFRTGNGVSPEISAFGVVFPGGGAARASVRVLAGGERAAVQKVEVPQLVAGRPVPYRESFRLPAGWAPRPIIEGLWVQDTAGNVANAQQQLAAVPDTSSPNVQITAPANGSSVVDGAAFQVSIGTSDNTEVDALDLLADGVVQQSWRVPGVSVQATVTLSQPASGAPVALTAVARDRFGNAQTSSPVYLTVNADGPPTLSLIRLLSAVEQATAAELEAGYVRLLQGTPATLSFSAVDDVGVVSVRATFDGEVLLDRTLDTPSKFLNDSVTFTPKVGQDGAASVLEIEVKDGKGATGRSRLVVESRRPQAPQLALVAPVVGATLAEGSIQLQVNAISGDDTSVAKVQYFVNGQLAFTFGTDIFLPHGGGIPVDGAVLGPGGLPLAEDPDIRAAAATFPTPFNDVRRLLQYPTFIALPPGFVKLDPNRTQTTVHVKVVATDAEGNSSAVDRDVIVVQDTTAPVAEIVRPTLGTDLVEGTPVRIDALAHDNVFVDRVELYAGPSASQLSLVYAAGGFPPVNAIPGSSFDIFAPPVTFELTMPLLSTLGVTERAPYFLAARARDVSGNWSDFFIQPVDVVRDREPSCAIVSPPDGSPAVANSQVLVVVDAEDDVGIQSVELTVNGAPFAPVLRTPPYSFLVPVPASQQQLQLSARAVDSFGHQVFSNVVILPIAPDRPPTVAIASPIEGGSVTEGRELAILVGAQDDVAVRSVQVVVEGGIGGTATFASTSQPYSFRMPLPFGSAGRSLTLHASATDTAGQMGTAVDVHVAVVKDTHPPTIAFVTPAPGSQVVAGQSVDVEARADDDVSVVNVAYTVNGTPYLTMPTPPYRFTYRFPKNAAGQTFTFGATATDPSANTASASTSIQVISDEPPSVTLIPPA
ncbi:MAG TPA: Ig-like domain-containing protein, partial [Myxococcaceae bacterium]|nr:Ig-like domain-containing protein [Myxococcaceae bacterium]